MEAKAPFVAPRMKVHARARFDVWLWLWAIYLIVQPFYVFPKGMPQPSDVLALLIFGVCFVRDGIGVPARVRASRALIAFVAWVFLVSAYWIVAVAGSGDGASDDIRVWRFPLFHFFNLIFFVGLIALFRRYGTRAFSWTFWGTQASLGLQVAAAFWTSLNVQQRATLYFENPNQLGYYALLAATLLVLCGKRCNAPSVAVVAGLLAAAFLNSLALSKAAGLGVLMLIGFLVVRRPLVVVAMGIVLFAALQLGLLDGLAARIEWRFAGLGSDVDDSFDARGYDRLLLFPRYLVFGAGEGATSRFGLNMSGELHSIVGTLVFSYGIIGFWLFARFTIYALRMVPGLDLLTLVPIAMYGLTHQGLRFRPFWVVLSVVAWIGFAETRRRRRLASRRHSHQAMIPGRESFDAGARQIRAPQGHG